MAKKRQRASAAERIGRNVKAARIRKGWSQRKLSDLTGISRPQITLIEAGRQEPRLERIEILALALGVSIAELLSLE